MPVKSLVAKLLNRGKSASGVAPAATPKPTAASKAVAPEASAPKTATPETVVPETATPEAAAGPEVTATPEVVGGPETVAPETPAAPAAEPTAKAAAEPAAASGLPLNDYDNRTIASVRAGLRNLSIEQLRQLIDYEKSNSGRADFIAMFERRIAKIESEK